MTIGNFKSQSMLDTLNLNNGIRYRNTYYYLDDISVVELRANAFADDTTICSSNGFTKKLRVFDGMYNVQWSTGDTTQAITISQEGTYWVTASNECGTVTDTIKIKLLNPNAYKFDLGNDTFYCTNFSKQLSIINPNLNNIIWSTNDTLPSININQQGTYWATAQSECGIQTDTITISQAILPNEIVLQNDTTIYVGDSIAINAIDGLQQYNWSNNSSSQSIIFTNPTIDGSWVWLTAYTQDGCLVSDSIKIKTIAKPIEELPIIVPSPQFIDKDKTFEIINLPINSAVVLYDALGRVVMDELNYSNNFKLNFLCIGIYYYHIVLPTGKVLKGKVFITT
jgi:predicted RNA-binding protein with PIN domain